MFPRWTLPPAAMLLATLAGCASFSPDGGIARVGALSSERIGHAVERDGPQTRARVDALLAEPLSVDAAVQLALLNNKRLQVALAELGIAEADLVQAGVLRNPKLSFGRLSGDGGVEIERSVMFDLGGLLTMPLRRAIEQQRFQGAQLQAALQVVRVAADTRRAWYQAVAAAQTLAYLKQAELAAEASAELGQRMAAVGNWSRLDEAREQVFHAEVSTQRRRAEHAAAAARERLVRLLGLTSEGSALRLPERLPPLPAGLQPPQQVEQRALAQRLDVQLSALETRFTARTLGLTRTTRFVNVLELGYQNSSESGSPRADGYEVELSLPLFDWGTARVRRAEAIYLRALQRTADVAVQARSEVREGDSLLRSHYEVARRYRDEIVPLRKKMSDETLLRYNGMLASVFELLADARAQIASVNAAIDAQRDFWIADSDLQFAIHGGSAVPALPSATVSQPAAAAAAAH